MSQYDSSEKAGFGKIFGRIFLGVMILAMIGSLALMDFGSMISGGAMGSQNVGRIGKKVITTQEFAGIYTRALQQSGLKPDVARQMGLPTMVVQQELERQLLIQAAHQSGIRISDSLLAKDLLKELEAITIPGTPKEKLQIILTNQNVTERDFTNMIRGDYSVNALGLAMDDHGLQIPEALVLASYRVEREKRTLRLVNVPYSAIIDTVKLDDAALRDYYEEHKESYRLPEKRTFSVLVLPQKLHTREVTISDTQAQEYYDDNSDAFMTPKRVKMEQIIVQDKDKATEIMRSSTDSLDTVKGDDIQHFMSDWYTQTSLPRELSDAIWSSKDTGILGPIKTSLGWHVLSITEYEEAKQKDFSAVKQDIKNVLKDDVLDDQINAFTTDLDMMISNGDTLEAIGKKYHLKTQMIADIDSLTAQENLKKLNQSETTRQKIQESGFTLEKGEISSLIDTDDNDFALVEVTNIMPSSIPTFETIKQNLRKDAEILAKQKALTDYAEELIRAYKPDNQDAFVKLLADKKLSVKNVGPLTRADMAKTQDEEIVNLAFSLSSQNTLSYTQQEDALTLVWLQDIIANTETPDDATYTEMRNRLRKDVINEVRQQYIQSWRNKLGMEINGSVLQQLTNPTAE